PTARVRTWNSRKRPCWAAARCGADRADFGSRRGRCGAGPGALRVLPAESLRDLVGAVAAVELAPELRDPGERAGVLFLVLGIEHVGVQVGDQGVLGPAGGAEAIAQRVVRHRLPGGVLGGQLLDHGAGLGLSLGEPAEA